MLKSFKQYFGILGHALIGIAFGYCCFYLLLNVYHYQEIRRSAYIDFENDVAIKEIDSILNNIDDSINKLSPNHYKGSLPYNTAFNIGKRLQVCTNSFRNKTFKELRDKKEIDIIDVYNFRESFSSNVLNECIVYQLYDFTLEGAINDEYMIKNRKLLRSYMDDLLQDTSYLEKDLESNSGYFYNTDMGYAMVKNNVRDGFYEVLSSYKRALKFVELISEWYESRIGGV